MSGIKRLIQEEIAEGQVSYKKGFSPEYMRSMKGTCHEEKSESYHKK